MDEGSEDPTAGKNWPADGKDKMKEMPSLCCVAWLCGWVSEID